MILRHPRTHRAGTATVEFAIVLAFVLIPLLIGSWEMGRIGEFQQIASNAAREGARRASSGQINTSETAAVVFDYLENSNIPTSNVKVTIQNLTGGYSIQYNSSPSVTSGTDWDLTGSNQNDQLRLTVEIPYNDLRWAQINPVYSGTTLTSQTTWWSLRDKDFPALADPPIE